MRRRRDYLRGRGSTVRWRAVRLGWAPDEWDALATGLGAPERVLRDTGLAFVNRRDRLQDTFRGCCSRSSTRPGDGRLRRPGAAGEVRIRPSTRTPPETAIYSKSRVLYGLNWAKSEIVKVDRVVVCEGYTDVIGFHRRVCRSPWPPRHGPGRARPAAEALRRPGGAGLRRRRRRAGSGGTLLRVGAPVRRDGRGGPPPRKDPGELAGEDPAGLRAAVDEAEPFLGPRGARVAFGRPGGHA